jgi:hypothetical protein
MTLSLLRRDTVVAAAAAGTVGAIVLDAFFLFIPFPNAPAPQPVAFYTLAATVLAGPSAAGASWAVPLGAFGHLALGIAWAAGYLQLTHSQPQLVRRPWISGLAFGFIVGLIMIGVLVLAGKYAPATTQAFDREIVGYTVFFGLPVALIAARLAPPAA